jgi:hypothetical protein
MNNYYCECGQPVSVPGHCEPCEKFHDDLDKLNAQKVIDDLNRANLEYYNRHMRLMHVGSQLRKEIYR